MYTNGRQVLRVLTLKRYIGRTGNLQCWRKDDFKQMYKEQIVTV